MIVTPLVAASVLFSGSGIFDRPIFKRRLNFPRTIKKNINKKCNCNGLKDHREKDHPNPWG